MIVQEEVKYMKVINKNVGTSMLSHYCPKCKQEVFNDSSVDFDEKKNCGVGKCPNCGTELEFPNVRRLLNLLDV